MLQKGILEDSEESEKKKEELSKRRKKVKEVIANTIMSVARIAN